MNTIDISPIIFKFGFFELRYYSLVYIFGILLLLYVLHKNKKSLQLTDDSIYSYLVYAIVGMLIGARLFHFLIDNPSLLFNYPLEFFKLWHGGMSFFGGFLGVLIASYYFCFKSKVNFFKFSDVIVLPISFALILGRLTNFINQELVGTVTNVPWCFHFQGYLGCRHPYQLYAAFSHLVLFVILAQLSKSKKKSKDGLVALSFVVLYALFRFIVDFFRADVRFFYFTPWQYISIIVFLISLYYLNKK